MIQVKFSDGSDGLPVGYPKDCMETKGTDLVPGFDVVWTVEQLQQAKADLRAQFVAIESQRYRSNLIAEMAKRIKEMRDQRKAAGVLVGSNWFHSDDSSRIQQLGLTIMGANMPPGIMWKTMSGSFVEMTPTLAGQIFQATAANDQAVFSVAEGHRIAMEAAEDPEAYDFTTGWPPIFGEV